MNGYAIDCQNVHKRYKHTHALRGVDLKIPAGSVCGLLGLNGAGKTTLIKSMLGLVHVQEGTIQLLGEYGPPPSEALKARISYVPQKTELYNWMRVDQVIAMFRSFYSNWNDDLVERLLKQWSLSPEQKLRNLSGGNEQKLSIILAMGNEPDLLLLDEPVASLDPAARRAFLREIIAIVGEGNRSVLFSTHITSDLERVADHAAVLRDGRIVFQGELDALKDSVKSIRLAFRDKAPNKIDVKGMLTCEMSDKTALLEVEGCSESMLTELSQRYEAEVSVDGMNLEEIFLAMHRMR